MRLRLDVEYDGTNYVGWQRQLNGPSVQQTLEEALGKLVGAPVVIHGAGRTDAGVHAQRMTAHAEVETRIPPEKLAYALNFQLPQDIRVCRSMQVTEAFHARFDATGKWYRYTFYHHPQGSALHHRTSAHVPYALDLAAMQEALAPLRGTHDFAAFAASGSIVKNTVRTIYNVALTQDGNLLLLDIMGNGFLYNMVRIIAGTLSDIGRGKLGTDAFARMIEMGERLEGGVTAPAQGLTLMCVYYHPLTENAPFSMENP